MDMDSRKIPGLLNPAFVAAALLTTSLSAADGPGISGNSGPQICQIASLRNGFTIQYSRHEVEGKTTRLWLCGAAGSGYVEIPSEQIGSFGPGPGPVALAPAAAPDAVKTTESGAALPAKDPIKRLIVSAASRHQIDPDFVASVVKAESGFNPTAVSPKGAQGLMQLMLGTAAELGVENVLDPAANVEGGTKYLRRLLDQYGGDAAKALAAYNAGPQRVEQYGGVPPYRETQAYVSRIIEDYNREKLRQQASSTGTAAGK